MSSTFSPWPAQTPSPSASSSSSSSSSTSTKRNSRSSKRLYKPERHGGTSKASRQLAYETSVDEAAAQCFASGNDVTSCFPNSNTEFVQGQWASFVWNSRLPEFTQYKMVDVYLYRGDSLEQLLHFPNQVNPSDRSGLVTAPVDDLWWGSDGTKWNGANLSYPFYWVVVRSDKGLTGNEIPQSRFHAIQTTYADSVVASMSSASAAASSSSRSAASLSSLSAASTRPSSGSSPTSTNLQSQQGGSSFPHWAIAVIVVLGFLALVALCLLIFFLSRHRRREREANRHSMGSSSPMMASVQNTASPQSPLLATGVVAGAHGSSDHHRGGSVAHDGASTISRANSAGDSGPFSGADAAIMADAFRKALRKPDFAGRPVEEGESPEGGVDRRKEELINQQLAEEGRDIRSVSSSRGVHVETMSDGGDTVQDHDTLHDHERR